MATGTVKFINTAKGFGFITQDAGDGDLFMHVSNIQAGTRPLQDGQRVQFEVQRGPKGLEAIKITSL
jgi:cold shock protein